MKDLPNHISEELLVKYFSGEASEEEKSSVDKWSASSPENHEELLIHKVVWEDLGIINLQDEVMSTNVDLDSAWDTHQTKRNDVHHSTKTKIKPARLAIAASIGIVLTFAWYFFQNNEPEQITLQTKGHTSEVSLQDGSLVSLNQNSELIYPKVFNTKSRLVEMTGEAFFEVEPNPKKPFIIKAGESQITVLGTAFNVHTSEKTDTITVFVEHGKVMLANHTNQLILTKGEKGMVIKGSDQILKITNESSGVDQFWKDKTLTFTGERMPEVIDILKKAYGKTIKLQSEGAKNCSLHVTFKEEKFEEILEIISATLNLEVVNQDSVTVLKGQGCEEE